MKTKPVDADRGHSESGSGESAADAMRRVQSEYVKQMAALASRFTEVMNKSLEITEAGMTMGLKLLGTGSEKLLSVITEKLVPAAAAPPQPAGSPAPQPQGGPVVGNAVPAVPGGSVYISFSISNDAADRSKRIRLTLSECIGSQTRQQLPPGSLAIAPDQKEILPLDFEKFIVSGIVPAESLPDTYEGWIVVDGDEQFNIHIVVTVMHPQAS
ncbi:MAG: hypothetical protein JW768_00210 [Chitinispirillaceae bacterium]|nr:hypothetical protein [Chitinispirillaceae bacterium]